MMDFPAILCACVDQQQNYRLAIVSLVLVDWNHSRRFDFAIKSPIQYISTSHGARISTKYIWIFSWSDFIPMHAMLAAIKILEGYLRGSCAEFSLLNWKLWKGKIETITHIATEKGKALQSIWFDSRENENDSLKEIMKLLNWNSG